MHLYPIDIEEQQLYHVRNSSCEPKSHHEGLMISVASKSESAAAASTMLPSVVQPTMTNIAAFLTLKWKGTGNQSISNVMYDKNA